MWPYGYALRLDCSDAQAITPPLRPVVRAAVPGAPAGRGATRTQAGSLNARGEVVGTWVQQPGSFRLVAGVTIICRWCSRAMFQRVSALRILAIASLAFTPSSVARHRVN